jgi:hypothetical protein
VSVRPETLATSEGTLVSICISVEPRRLEAMLEALATVRFPVNPEIFHDAAVVTSSVGVREEPESTTLVEFPAYAERLDEVRTVLQRFDFDPVCMTVTGMLEQIQSETRHGRQ